MLTHHVCFVLLECHEKAIWWVGGHFENCTVKRRFRGLPNVIPCLPDVSGNEISVNFSTGSSPRKSAFSSYVANALEEFIMHTAGMLLIALTYMSDGYLKCGVFY